MSDATLTLLLWSATALLLGWTWIPAFVAGLGGARFHVEGSEDPTVLAPGSHETDYAAWCNRVTALGYEPLGTARMRISCHGPVWRYETPLRIFHSRTKQAYAFVQKQPRPMDVWSLAMFATCWSDGSLLLTSNALEEKPTDDAYAVQGMQTDDLAAVEAMHLATCDRMRASGKRPERDGSLDTLLTAIRRHSGQAARYVALKLGQTYLTTHGVVHVILSVPVVYVNGFGHWSLPLVNLIFGALLAGGEHVAKLRAGKMMGQQARAHADGDRP